MPESIREKLARFEKALQLFLERVRADSNLLAAVLVGSLSEETVWRRDAISLWLIEKDGVTKRLRADGEDPREVYLDLLAAPRTAERLGNTLAALDGYLEKNAEARLRPVLRYLRKEKRLVPLSELADHFAHSQLYPWHLESACEWLERKGWIGKFSAPFGLTKMSRVEVEEPAYLCEEG